MSQFGGYADADSRMTLASETIGRLWTTALSRLPDDGGSDTQQLPRIVFSGEPHMLYRRDTTAGAWSMAGIQDINRVFAQTQIDLATELDHEVASIDRADTPHDTACTIETSNGPLSVLATDHSLVFKSNGPVDAVDAALLSMGFPLEHPLKQSRPTQRATVVFRRIIEYLESVISSSVATGSGLKGNGMIIAASESPRRGDAANHWLEYMMQASFLPSLIHADKIQSLRTPFLEQADFTLIVSKRYDSRRKTGANYWSISDAAEKFGKSIVIGDMTTEGRRAVEALQELEGEAHFVVDTVIKAQEIKPPQWTFAASRTIWQPKQVGKKASITFIGGNGDNVGR